MFDNVRNAPMKYYILLAKSEKAYDMLKFIEVCFYFISNLLVCINKHSLSSQPLRFQQKEYTLTIVLVRNAYSKNFQIIPGIYLWFNFFLPKS